MQNNSASTSYLILSYLATSLRELVTIAIQGFQKVKANIIWEASVVITAHKTQIIFFPSLSTRSPKTGDMGADMIYTILQKNKNKRTEHYQAMDSFRCCTVQVSPDKIPYSLVTCKAIPKTTQKTPPWTTDTKTQNSQMVQGHENTQHPRKQWHTWSSWNHKPASVLLLVFIFWFWFFFFATSQIHLQTRKINLI